MEMASAAWVGLVPPEATPPTAAEMEAHSIALTRLVELSHQHRIPRQNFTTVVADSVVVWVPEGNLVQADQPAAATEPPAPESASLPEPMQKKKRTKKTHEIRVLDPPLSATDQRLLGANDLEYTIYFGYSAASIRNEFRDVHEPGVTHLPPGPRNDGLRLAGWYVFQRYQRQHGL
jgi:hypothetical protein